MDYKKSIIEFADRIDALKGKLVLATKSEAVFPDVKKLTSDMENALKDNKDEMYYAALYNARATIMTAPEKCPVNQLKEALCDSAEELRLMSEYFDNQNT